jgi:hypothetical protein
MAAISCQFTGTVRSDGMGKCPSVAHGREGEISVKTSL